MVESNKQHAVVIGGGFGGLASALRLLKRGYHVTIVDKNQELGGKAGTLRSGPYLYDTGPTVITARHLIDELFTLFGKQTEDYVTLKPVKPWYRYQFHDGKTIDYDQAIEKTIFTSFSEELAAYQAFSRYTEKLFSIGFETYGTRPFDQLSTFIGAVPSLLKNRAMKSVYATCKTFFKDPHLVKAFSIPPLLVGGGIPEKHLRSTY